MEIVVTDLLIGRTDSVLHLVGLTLKFAFFNI